MQPDPPIGKLLAIAEASEEENLPKLNFDPNMQQSLRLNQDSGLQSPNAINMELNEERREVEKRASMQQATGESAAKSARISPLGSRKGGRGSR